MYVKKFFPLKVHKFASIPALLLMLSIAYVLCKLKM